MGALINPPSKLISAEGDEIECKFALEPSFVCLVSEAKNAGWDELQVAFSLISLCDSIIYGVKPKD
ncbi:hypothetical protein [Brucella anthropi]|uniref:hypothetical protein n=1 Tax=Brucella anthropi TaxID=529 RepID=UPI0004ED85F1|nr:hypothetical protein [Brucella anthropi]AIK41038.1 hypothetical protein DR92_4652 [Brucella anthropi]KAB2774468.1 hypothetical protein F9K99_23770 [Brucella anthropi]SUB55980.1 Uncharacterised protein [Brucella anthropi]